MDRKDEQSPHPDPIGRSEVYHRASRRQDPLASFDVVDPPPPRLLAPRLLAPRLLAPRLLLAAGLRLKHTKIIHKAYGGWLKHECRGNDLDFGAIACCPCLGTLFGAFQRVCPPGSERSFCSPIHVLLDAGLNARPFRSVEPRHRICGAGRLPVRSVSAKTTRIGRCRRGQTANRRSGSFCSKGPS